MNCKHLIIDCFFFSWSTLIMASLQTPEVMIVIGLAGILLIVILIACITIMVCMNRPAGYNGMRPNRVYYYGNGTNGSMHQPPSTTNSQNITQSLYIYGDGGRWDNIYLFVSSHVSVEHDYSDKLCHVWNINPLLCRFESFVCVIIGLNW